MENVKLLCRICLANIRNDVQHKYVFGKDTKNVIIAKKIYDVTGIFIQKTNYLPERICSTCIRILNLAYVFRLTCQETDIKLKKSAFATNIAQVIETKSNLPQLLNEVEEDFDEFQEFSENEDKASANYDQLHKKTKYSDCKIETKPSKKYSNTNNNYVAEYKCIRRTNDKELVRCTTCKCKFSIIYGGRSDIIRHINSKKHKENTDPLTMPDLEPESPGNSRKQDKSISTAFLNDESFCCSDEESKYTNFFKVKRETSKENLNKRKIVWNDDEEKISAMITEEHKNKLIKLQETANQILLYERKIFEEVVSLHQRNSSESEDMEINKLKLPIQTKEDLIDLEESLSNDVEIKRCLKSSFIKNTNDLTKFVQLNLKNIMTDAVASNFSWFGHQNNIAIKDYLIIKLLKDTALISFNKSSENEVDNLIKKWFQLAKDRKRKLLKREPII